MASPLPAWLYPITQEFGGGALGATERGTDYGTPFHTPVAAPFAGTVVGESYGGYGGEVDIATSVPGTPVKTETLLHLDQIFAPKGAQVAAGQVVGLSGGQLSGGSHPASSLFSTGPHTEIDLWTGSPWASPSLNPDPILKRLGGAFGAASGSVTPPPASNPVAQTWDDFLKGLSIGASTAKSSLPSINIANVVPNPFAGFNAALQGDIGGVFGGIGSFLRSQIVALAVAAVVLLILFS